jgi:hypothetical protein
MRLVLLSVSLVAILAGCASENPNIVNPPPGSVRIAVRLFNMVADGKSRKLLLEYGYQSKDVGQFRFSDSVRSPGDSSFIEIVEGGRTELRTARRVPFAPNAVYDVYTLPAIGDPAVFDTILVTNANSALTTVPVAQVRVVNVLPDTARTYEVRVGCPNGTPLTRIPVRFGTTSAYSEVYPGLAVFSVIETTNGVSTVLGTYEAFLGERRAYTILVYRDVPSPNAILMFYEEGDLTTGAERSLTPVSTRTANVRVVNVSTVSVDVALASSSLTIARGVSPSRVSSMTTAPSCTSEQADRFEATYADGRTAVDSTSLSVSGNYTVITTDTGSAGRLVITPSIQRPFSSGGKAVIRVVNASPKAGSIVVSIGARSDATVQGGISAGQTIARNVGFDAMSDPIAVNAGVVPITVTTSAGPTTILTTGRSTLEADRSYDLIVFEREGSTVAAVLEEGVVSTALEPISDGVFTRIVNGSSQRTTIDISVGDVLPTGTLYPGSSVATVLNVGSVPYRINTVDGTLSTRKGERTLVVAATRGGTPTVIDITTPPLTPQLGQTSRRVVNATDDIPSVSASIDSIPSVSGDGEHLARNVDVGTASTPYVTTLDRRGTYYFYDAATRTQLYTLPVQLAPLGNNYTFIIVGRKDTGYEVLVSQEF